MSACRRAALDAGIAIIAAVLLEFICTYIFSYIAVGLLKLSDDELYRAIIRQSYGTIVSYLPKLAAFGFLYSKYRRAEHLFTKYRTSPLWLILLLLSLIVFGMWGSNVTSAVNLLLQMLFGAGEIPNVMDAAAPTSLTSGIVSLIYTMIVAPIAEELIYRRFMLGSLRVIGDVPAVIVSALIFGLAHGNFDQFCYCFFGGIIFGLCMIRYGSIKYGIALHMVHNMFVTLVYYSDVIVSGGGLWQTISGALSTVGSYIISLSYYAGPAIALLLVLSDLPRLERVSGADRYKKLTVFFSPVFVAALLLMLISFI